MSAVLVIGLVILLSEDGAIHYGNNPVKMNWENEGPYIFLDGDSIFTVQYLAGKQDDGFSIDGNRYSVFADYV
jgi:hypothetical protein